MKHLAAHSEISLNIMVQSDNRKRRQAARDELIRRALADVAASQRKLSVHYDRIIAELS